MRKFLLITLMILCFEIFFADSNNKQNIAINTGAQGDFGVGQNQTTGGSAKIGFRVEKTDNYYIELMYSYSGITRILGNQRDFGNFLLNPSIDQDYSFHVNASYILNNDWKCPFFDNNGILYGISFKSSVTFSQWSSIITNLTNEINGFLIDINFPSLLLESTTIQFLGSNTIQGGCELGLGIKILGGDLSQSPDFIANNNVLGLNQTVFFGGVFNIFANINESIQPFIRLSYYNAPTIIKNFTGVQAVMGINIVSSLISSK